MAWAENLTCARRAEGGGDTTPGETLVLQRARSPRSLRGVGTKVPGHRPGGCEARAAGAGPALPEGHRRKLRSHLAKSDGCPLWSLHLVPGP